MAIKRIKSTWYRPEGVDAEDKTLDEVAGALAYIVWRIALESAKGLHGEGYDYRTDQQRVAAIAEFVAYLVQAADRLTFEMLEQADREHFINALARRLAGHFQDNLVDLFGPGEYTEPFIATLNERMDDYAGLSFSDGQPGYDFLRYFGDRVLRVMGNTQTNRWVIDQIMEKSGPEAVKHLRGSLRNLFA